MTREEAIKILRPTHGLSSLSIRAALETLAPELRENEDERIRKALVDMVKRETGFTGFAGSPSQGQVLAYLEKLKVQKFEWTEKDEEMARFYVGHNNEHDYMPLKFKDWLINRLKSIRPQPKQEWSEEDDWKRKELIQYLEEKGDYRTVWMTWLKSLRPSWKPSEEHFQGLRRAILKADTDSDAERTLKDLYEQLKKL